MRRPLLSCLGIGLALCLLTVQLGFMLDDYMHLANTEGILSVARPLGYFTFISSPDDVQAYTARGPLPWWTLPELKLAFFRPLSSALISFDHSVFPRAMATEIGP